MYEREAAERDQRLADFLGLTLEEYQALEAEVLDNSSDDGLVYYYYLDISDEAPREVTGKLKARFGDLAQIPTYIVDPD